MLGLETFAWTIGYSWFSASALEYLKEKIPESFKDSFKDTMKDVGSKFFNKNKERKDKGNYFQDAFGYAFSESIKSIESEWLKTATTDLQIRDAYVRKLLGIYYNKEKVFELYNNSKEVNDAEVFEFLLDKQFSKDKLQEAFFARTKERLIEPIIEQVKNCSNINPNKSNRIMEEGNALVAALEEKLLPLIYKKLRNRIQYDDDYFRAIVFDSLLNLNTEVAKLGNKEIELVKIEELFNKAIAEHSGLSLEKLDQLSEQIGTVSHIATETKEGVAGLKQQVGRLTDLLESAISPTGDLTTNGRTINIIQFAEYRQIQADISEIESDLEDIPTSKPERRKNKLDKLEQRKKDLEQFKIEVVRLAKTFETNTGNSERLKKAREFFMQGKLKEADQELNELDLNKTKESLLEKKERLEADLKNNSEEFLTKAKISQIDFENPNRMEDTKRFFESSIEIYKTKENLFEYAFFLQEHKQFSDAIGYYTEALNIYRKLAEQNPEAYLPDVARTLNNFGALQSAQNKYELSLQYYTEALDIYRKLAEQNPEAYLPDVATILNNLGNLQSDLKKYELSLQYYTEALNIRRKLAEQNPEAYLPDVADTLYNLGILQKAQNKYELSLQYYTEALNIRRKLAEQNPEAYLPKVAWSLNSLGYFLKDQEKALASLLEALEIMKTVANENPNAYLLDVAGIMHSLAEFYQNKVLDKEKSLSYIAQAMEICKSFDLDNPKVMERMKECEDVISRFSNL